MPTLTDSPVQRYAIRTPTLDVDINYANATSEFEALEDWAYRCCVGPYATAYLPGPTASTGHWCLIVNGRQYTARAI